MAELNKKEGSASKEPSPEPLKPAAPRPDWSTTPTVAVTPKPSPSFQKTLDSQKQSGSGASVTPVSSSNGSSSDDQIKEGEPCKNGGCKLVSTEIVIQKV